MRFHVSGVQSLFTKASTAVRYQRILRTFTFLLLVLLAVAPAGLTSQQKEVPRAIISDDFNKLRPKASLRTKSRTRPSRRYRLAATAQGKSTGVSNSETLPLGLTIWELKPRDGSYGANQNTRWQARRVEADTKFRAGDLLRLSIESPRGGYLYVINRDLFPDGSPGETNLIFPKRGENNLLEGGRLIDIPAENQAPFRANPKPNQSGEYLVIIVTSTPLALPLYDKTLPISNAQLMEWEERWSGFTERFEMNGGAGQARTIAEHEASSLKGTRQLTRDDPSPQTIFYLTPKNNDGLLFNLMLSYAR